MICVKTRRTFPGLRHTLQASDITQLATPMAAFKAICFCLVSIALGARVLHKGRDPHQGPAAAARRVYLRSRRNGLYACHDGRIVIVSSSGCPWTWQSSAEYGWDYLHDGGKYMHVDWSHLWRKEVFWWDGGNYENKWNATRFGSAYTFRNAHSKSLLYSHPERRVEHSGENDIGIEWDVIDV